LEKFNELLRKNSSLKVFDLGWNNFGDEGTTKICESIIMNNNNSLTELYLGSNG